MFFLYFLSITVQRNERPAYCDLKLLLFFYHILQIRYRLYSSSRVLSVWVIFFPNSKKPFYEPCDIAQISTQLFIQALVCVVFCCWQSIRGNLMHLFSLNQCTDMEWPSPTPAGLKCYSKAPAGARNQSHSHLLLA